LTWNLTKVEPGQSFKKFAALVYEINFTYYYY
jgi:hypothetical protein